MLLSAAIAAVGVASHLAAIAGGAGWYAYFGAPPFIVASAREGSWLAPASAAAIAALMGLCAAYACAAAGRIRRLPLQRTALACIALIWIARSLILIPFAFMHPQLFNLFEVLAALVWGAAGIGFAVGFMADRRSGALAA